MSKVPLATDIMQPITRLDDADIFIIHWAGGLQSAQRDKDTWQVLPVYFAGKPHASGYYSRAAMRAFLLKRGVKFVAFQQIIWMKGEYISHWIPNLPGESNFHESPADLWGRVASNLGRSRSAPLIQALQDPTMQEIEAIRDVQSEPERLARSISLTLRSLDTSVSQIAAFYNEELTNLLASGRIDGHRSSSTRDQTLYALVHSFFLHLGSARDYIGAFIAHQLGKDPRKTDSMARLIEVIRGSDICVYPLLQLLESKGCIRPKGTASTKWEAAGWLEEATDLRNEFTHRRTYGYTRKEQMGYLHAIDSNAGLHRYFRPISWKTFDQDIFDVIIDNYEHINELFFAAAKLSGHDLSIPFITNTDIISVEETTRK